MQTVKHPLQLALLDCLQANLNGLNERHTKKLHTLAAKATDELAENFAKLQGKEQKAAKEAAVLETSRGQAASRSSRPKPTLTMTKAA
jgi:hypothetical protein